MREKTRRWAAANKEKESVRHKKARKENPQRFRDATKRWRKRNPDKCKEYESKYFRNNKDKRYAKASKYRAQLLQAMPIWADQDAIIRIYSECVKISKKTGVIYHVDHIVPLKSKIVCGLHCEANLQILTKEENLKKHNSYWPDMP